MGDGRLGPASCLTAASWFRKRGLNCWQRRFWSLASPALLRYQALLRSSVHRCCAPYSMDRLGPCRGCCRGISDRRVRRPYRPESAPVTCPCPLPHIWGRGCPPPRRIQSAIPASQRQPERAFPRLPPKATSQGSPFNRLKITQSCLVLKTKSACL